MSSRGSGGRASGASRERGSRCTSGARRAGRLLPWALLAAFALPGRAAAQADGPEALAGALRGHVAQAVAERSGRLLIRPRVALPDAAPRRWALVADLLAPTVAALRGAERFEAVHVGLFRGDGREAAVRAGRLGYDALVDLELRLVGARLVVEARAWDVERPDDPARFEVVQRLDVALRRYVGFPSRVTSETVVARTAALPSRGYLALAVHDLDRDGRTEVVAVHPDGAQVFHLGAARVGLRLEEVGRAPWPPTARDPSPPPRPLATATATEDAIVTRLGDRAAPLRVRLVGARVVVDRADGPCPDARFPLRGACAQLVEGRDFFAPTLARRGGPAHEAAAHFYAWAERALRTRDDEAVRFEALVTPGGRLAVRVRREAPASDGPNALRERSVGAVGYGTALAMTDLDVDGSAELLTSHAAPAGAGDQLSLLRALPRGALHVVWRSEPMAGSVFCAASGDLDGDGLDEMVAIEEPADPAQGTARLWIVR